MPELQDRTRRGVQAAPKADAHRPHITPDPSRTQDWLALAAALVSVVLWASAFIGIRAAGRDFSPGALALGRLLLGSIVLGALVWSGRWVKPTRRQLAIVTFAGLIWFGLYNVVLNEAEQRVDAGTAAMLVNIGPILIVILAALFLRERLTRGLLAGGAVAFAGVIVIGLATTSGNAPLVGVVLCLVAALAYAAGVVAQKSVLDRLPAKQVTWMCCTIGGLFCVPFAPTLLRELNTASTGSVVWMAYLAAFPTAVGFTTWAYALARGTAGRVAATTYLVPAIAIVMSWLVLGEVPSVIAVLGGALCLVGVYTARRLPSKVPQ